MMRVRFTKLLSKRPVVIICRILLAAIFIYAAVGKLLNPADFADNVAGFRILPFWSVNFFAIILPWIEIICAISLLIGIGVRSSGLLLIGLNIMFIAAAISAMARGLSINCGCFTLSKAHDSVGWNLIIRDIAFMLLCLPLILPSHKPSKSIHS